MNILHKFGPDFGTPLASQDGMDRASFPGSTAVGPTATEADDD